MDNNKNQNNKTSFLLSIWLPISFAIGIATLTTVFSLYFYHQEFSLFEAPYKRENWAYLGDYIAGTIGTGLLLSTLIALFITIIQQQKLIRIQDKELSATRTESEKLANANLKICAYQSLTSIFPVLISKIKPKIEFIIEMDFVNGRVSGLFSLYNEKEQNLDELLDLIPKIKSKATEIELEVNAIVSYMYTNSLLGDDIKFYIKNITEDFILNLTITFFLLENNNLYYEKFRYLVELLSKKERSYFARCIFLHFYGKEAKKLSIEGINEIIKKISNDLKNERVVRPSINNYL